MSLGGTAMTRSTITTSVTARRPRRAVTVFAIGALVAILGACAAPGAPMPLDQIKRNEFGNRALAESAQIAAGTAQPVLEFTVENTPPSIFVNYVVPDDRAVDFEAFVDLPPGFALTKVRILESDPEPRYWLSLNVYRVSGLTEGLRAEWSTYVDDGSGSPRFMIVRARASEGSLDPIGPLALPEPFAHSVDAAGVISTDMQRTELQGAVPVLTPDDLFSSSITLPDVADRQLATPTLEWVAANDFIYWLNGVNDRTYYNSTAHSAPLLSVDLADVTIDDQTEWTPFIDPTPQHVLVYLDRIQFSITPWWNVTEPDGRVDPATRANLLALKRQIYGGLSNVSALAVLNGTGEPIVQSSVASDEPSTYWHWRIPADRLDDLAAAAELPDDLTLAPVLLQAGDPAPDHWLTLNVWREAGTGLRSQWSTTVDDGSGTRAVVLENRADHPSLDPVDRFTEPFPIQHSVAGSTLATTVGTGPGAFASTVPLPAAGTGATVLPDRVVGRRQRPALLAQRGRGPRLHRQHCTGPEARHRSLRGPDDGRRTVDAVRRRRPGTGLGGPDGNGPGDEPVVEPRHPMTA